MKQYVSFFSKIISDKCIKNTPLKCIILDFLKTILIKEKFFTDEEIISMFNFINEIHNNKIYKDEIYDFTKYLIIN